MERDNKFYIVDTVCGHVGKGRCVIKSFAIEAENAKEAAAIGRFIPRVKHHYKYAIQNVHEVSLEKYVIQKLFNEFDPYLHVSNRSNQTMLCEDLEILNLSDLREETDYKRSSKVGRKKYINNYMMDASDINEYRYAG